MTETEQGRTIYKIVDETGGVLCVCFSLEAATELLEQNRGKGLHLEEETANTFFNREDAGQWLTLQTDEQPTE